ncbi:MAG TPA: 1-(5-phosphoribosyl)-5-[(5-phosphoribosylamino)methylideneamino]imidazole-4-carboxamide isomerase [Actinomycetota bacterium]|nr:1-(5-phosphoribosyl)-5-[(5-phosphoribosylamino)methylideneamino]imidazole-4-carboxamide isomerase [Actinomycetota bacterium]
MVVIPAIDLREGRVVRLRRGDPGTATVYGDDPVAVARRFEEGGARRLHVVDLDAALGEGDNRDAIVAICRAVHARVQVGGGVRSVAAAKELLAAGAARVVLGTRAALDPAFVREAVAAAGDRVIVALDVRAGRIRVAGWREEGPPLEEALAALDAAGAPRFLVTAIDADGVLAGPDLELYRAVLARTERPVLASGGVRGADDVRALAELGVEGVVVGRALYEGTLRLEEVAG